MAVIYHTECILLFIPTTQRTFYLKKESVRRQIDAFDYEEDDGTIRKEVFNGTSTVVEVAIKTKTKKGGKNKNNKNRNADEIREAIQ